MTSSAARSDSSGNGLVAAVRERADLLLVLLHYGIGARPGARYACPFHGGTNLNFLISDDGKLGTCFSGCGRTFDPFDAERALGGGSFWEAVTRLARRLGIDGRETRAERMSRLQREAAAARERARREAEDRLRRDSWRSTMMKVRAARRSGDQRREDAELARLDDLEAEWREWRDAHGYRSGRAARAIEGMWATWRIENAVQRVLSEVRPS